ncbi:MAG: hypothetical protein F2813_04840 [Actinobacteria bacterium]|nr:hypothetical protein [Actinomycetota bacterium]
MKELWDRGQRGWPASAPIAQFPNAPLLTAIAAWIVGQFSSGSLNDAASAVFYVALACFAWWEVTDGVNRFRRFAGGAVLLFVVVSLAGKLGG